MKKSAFTLIELLVVIVIIGILATISVAQFNNYAVRARDATRTAQFSQIQKHIITHTIANGSFPSIAYEGGVSEPGSGGWYFIIGSRQDSIEGLHLTDSVGVLSAPNGLPEIGISFYIYRANSETTCAVNSRQFVVITWFEDATALNKFSLATPDSNGMKCRAGLYKYNKNSIVRVFHEGDYQ